MANVFLNADETGVNIANDGDVVFGQSGDESVNILAGVTGVVLDQNIEGVTLGGNKADYTFEQAGNQLLIKSGGETVAIVPIQVDADGTQLTFDDGTFNAVFNSGVIEVGSDPVDPTDPTDPTDGETFTLTTGADNGEDFVGTTGDDSYVASLGTLNANDSLDGGDGDDTLDAELTGNLNNTITVANIEDISFEVLAGLTTVDTTNYSGVDSYTSDGVGALTLNNLNGSSAALVKDGNSSALTANYAAGTVAGGNDTQNIELQGSTGGLITLGAGVENVVITSETGDTSTAQLNAAGLLLTINGGGTVTLGNTVNPINATYTTIDARDTAAVTLTAAGAATASYLTGGGDDSLTLNVDIGAAASNLISMGGGDDTLKLTAAQTAVNPATIVGVENVAFTNVAPGLLDLANSSGDIAFDIQNGGALTLNNAQSGISLGASTAGTVGNLAVNYRTTVMDEELTIDLGRDMTGSLTVTNLNSFVLNFSASAASTLAAGILVDATAAGTDVTESFTVNNNGTGAVTLGVISDVLAGTTTDITDIVLNAATGAIIDGGIANAQDLTNVTMTAGLGAITTASYGLGNASTKLDSVTLTATGAAIDDIGGLVEFTTSNVAGVSTIELNAAGGAIGATNAIDFVNTTGGFGDVTITGAKAVNANITARGTGTVDTVTSTNTNSVTLTIADAGLVAGETGTTVTLGNASVGNANTLVTGSGNDTITDGTGTDNIIAGAGGDAIDISGGNDAITQGAAGAVAAGDGMVGLFNDTDGSANVTDGDTLTFVNGVDTITGFTVSNGGAVTDTLTIIASLGGAIAVGGGAGALDGGFAGAGTGAIADDTYALVRGDYANGVFTVNAATGADQAVIYDGDAAAGTISSETIILMGIGGTGLTVTSDLLFT